MIYRGSSETYGEVMEGVQQGALRYLGRLLGWNGLVALVVPGMVPRAGTFT